MKNSMKKMLALLLTLAMLCTIALQLVACGDNNDGNVTPSDCTDHIDSDGDGKCDNCGATVENQGGNNGDNGGNTPDADGKLNYNITVKSAGGMALDGILIYVYDSNGSMVTRTETDEDGKASVTVPSGCSIELDDVPDGYSVEDSYRLTVGGTNITLTSKPIEGTLDDAKNGYDLGDVVHDFSYTDINGKTYKVSEILAEKDLLVLNFWYYGCTWCSTEMPYLNSAYVKYSDKVEILALNDYAGNDLDDVLNYQVSDSDGNAVELQFPLFKLDNKIINKFDKLSQGYPVTVAIDRYGVICMVHVGGIPSERYFTNMFDHFIGEDYEQMLADDIEDFSPRQIPNVEMPSSDEINAAVTGNGMNGNKLNITYRPGESEYSWPFIITTKNGETCIVPSNTDKDNSFAILYADVYLEAGEALMFDYISSTDSDDILHILVDDNQIYTISGVAEDQNAWKTCCTYVAQRSGTYKVTFTYIKDISEYKGDDTVYIKNIRGGTTNDITVPTYIYREAATDPNEWNDGFNFYASVVYNAKDGYYHVGTVDGPILIANLLLYTPFESGTTFFERFYDNVDASGNVIFNVNNVNVADTLESYGAIASNSDMYGYCSVTLELAEMLKAHVAMYAVEAGWDADDENLWLSLCVYYDAYGPDVTQLEDPVKGLAPFSAFRAELGENTENNVINKVTYSKVIIPRGLFYAFTPTESGVYRITSNSEYSVIGWLYGIDDPELGKYIAPTEIICTETSSERFVEDLIYVSGYTIACEKCGAILSIGVDQTEITCTDKVCGHKMTGITAAQKNTVTSKDYNNISMLSKLEAGKTYYIAIAYVDTDQLGSFTFDIKKVDDVENKFVEASPGPFTADIDSTGFFGQILAGGIDYILCDDDHCAACAAAAIEADSAAGTKYYHHLITNDDGSKKLGSILYADFYMYTSIFPSQSILDLIDIDAFNFSITETDRTARQWLSAMFTEGKKVLYAQWDEENGSELPQNTKDSRWNEYKMTDVLWGHTAGLNTDKLATAMEWKQIVVAAGKEYLKDDNVWGSDFNKYWSEYQMEDVLNGIYHATDDDKMDSLDKKAVTDLKTAFVVAKNELKANLLGNGMSEDEFNAMWTRLDMDNAIWYDFSNLDQTAETEAKDYADIVRESAIEYIRDTIVPNREDTPTYDAYMEHYRIADVMNRVYHGNATDYSDIIRTYIDKMYSGAKDVQRQGCVAVDEQLAIILQGIVDKELFENVDGGWRKFCYYYQAL